MRKRANGKGSVYKLSGKRSNPWAVRKTIGYNEKGQPKYKFIGFYRTYEEANKVLTEYNKSPYSLNKERLCDMYEGFFAQYVTNHTEGSIKNVRTWWDHLAPLHEEYVASLSRKKIQIYFDNLNVSESVKRKIKSLLKLILDYSIRYDVIQPERIVILNYIDLTSRVEIRKINRRVFTQEEIDKLWSIDDDIAHLLLFLIYTGLRAGEYCDLTDDSIDEDKVIHITKSKTESGVRLVPLSEKAQKLAPLPHFNNYPIMKYHFNNWCKLHGFEHTLHDTRHTCVSLLANIGTDKRIIQAIVGHKGKDITDQVYTHIDIQTMRKALNKI